MNALLQALAHHARQTPERSALVGDQTELDYRSLQQLIDQTAARLRTAGVRRLGLLMDNSPAWAAVDLAALSLGVTLVPLPGFFSEQQLLHTIQAAGLQSVITDRPATLTALLDRAVLRPWPRIAGVDVWQLMLPESRAPATPEGTAKITFTSGTTGQPKGVCLSASSLTKVAASLAALAPHQDGDRHLSLLPLPILLENVAGLYAALIRGTPCSLPSSKRLGSDGASHLDAASMFGHLARSGASSIILTPQMLAGLVQAVEQGLSVPRLGFVAVGGASVTPSLLSRAERAGLPVYEGYGLSECASVVAVNTPAARRLGSVGRPLPHVDLRIAEDGEVLLGGIRHLGYLGQPAAAAQPWLASGDLGRIDADGYLYVTGRKKHLYITSYGRNVSPEWPEQVLAGDQAIAQAVVFGEGRPWAAAVITANPGYGADDIEAGLQRANGHLPGYARIGGWLPADEAFSPGNGLLTLNGRPRRDAIWARYGDRIESLY